MSPDCPLAFPLLVPPGRADLPKAQRRRASPASRAQRVPESGSLSLANALAAVALDPSTGVLTSSLPIETPAARGGPQPRLALTYNSAAGIREAGVGWGLNVPSIERQNRDGAPRYQDPSPNGFDVGFRAMDRFVFDGKPLVPICVVSNFACIDSSAVLEACRFPVG